MSKDLTKVSLKDLKGLAKHLGMTGYSKLNKSDLIEAIEANQEEEPLKQLTDIIDFDWICRVKGKAGLWIPEKKVKSKNNVVRFMDLLDNSIKTTSFKGFDVLGHNIHMMASFNAAYVSGLEIENALEIADKFTLGEQKKYAKWYKIIMELLDDSIEDKPTQKTS